MNFKKLSVLFCSLLALTSVMAVSAAETETVSETEATSEEESTASGADEETEYPITIQHAYGETVIESKPEHAAGTRHCSCGRFCRQLWYGNRKQSASLDRRGLPGTGC